jgi:CRISPR-associated protein Cas5d
MKGFCLEVSGPYACFTRPEMKVERVSYDVITPSAARAIFDAILWKPAIRWEVKRIEVLSPIRWISVRRNEVGRNMSNSGGFFIDETNSEGKLVNRQQRAGLFLRDVKYRIHAEFVFIPPDKRGKVHNPVPEWLMDSVEAEALAKADVRPDETEAKYAAMFERRARKGQCFNQPYLGCREFSAEFRLVDLTMDPTIWPAECGTPDLGFGHPRDLGWMLYDLDFSDLTSPKPQFFHARIEDGAIDLGDVEVRS